MKIYDVYINENQEVQSNRFHDCADVKLELIAKHCFDDLLKLAQGLAAHLEHCDGSVCFDNSPLAIYTLNEFKEANRRFCL